MVEVADLEQQIRGFINNPRRQHALIKRPAAWNKLCSCLDLIGDTEMAIDAYLKHHEPVGDGEKYLLLYAVLQALILQQDAVDHLCEALDIDYVRDLLLQEIRNIRNSSIGHPIDAEYGRKSCFISRATISRYGFQLMISFPDGRLPEFRNVNIPNLIKGQRDVLRKVLSSVIDKLRSEEMEHREKFKDKKLQELFPKILGYYFEKISQTIPVHMDVNWGSYGSSHVQLIIECIKQFKSALDERGHPKPDHLLKEMTYPLDELMKFFQKPNESKLNDQDAYIFLFFIRAKMDELEQIAKELDEGYSTPP